MARQQTSAAQLASATFARKLTSSAAWLRPVTEPAAVMRIVGRMREGWQEISTLGAFVRWQGRFTALCRRQDDPTDAEGRAVVRVDSYNLIMPAIVSDWLQSYMQAETLDVNRADPDERRTGLHFKPVNGLDEIEFAFDLIIVPPKPGKESKTGYEFAFDILRADPRHEPMAALTAGLDGFAGLPAPRMPGAVPEAVTAEEMAAGVHPETGEVAAAAD